MMSRNRVLLMVALLLISLVLFRAALASTNGAPPLPKAHAYPLYSDLPDAADVQRITLDPVTTNAGIVKLVAQVDGNRWLADVTTLAQFGNTRSNSWGTRYVFADGNLAARDWISSTLAGLGWTPYFHTFSYFGTRYNVIGERIGDTYPENIYIVGAHYDSVSPEGYTLAPGAEDNASSTAALLEIARVLQDQTPASTIRLIAFSAEEQGVIGSRAYASHLADVSHEIGNIRGVYIMDMIGYTTNPDSLHVVLQSRNPNIYTWMGDTREHLASTAAAYTTLRVYTSDNACCSDHVPFLSREVPAVLLIGAEFHSYPYYHTIDDLPRYVVPAEGAEVIKAVVADLASKAGVICLFADVNCDGVVGLMDLTNIAQRWRSSRGDTGYTDRHDLNDDRQINVVDMQLAALAFTQ